MGSGIVGNAYSMSVLNKSVAYSTVRLGPNDVGFHHTLPTTTTQTVPEREWNGCGDESVRDSHL